MRPRVAAGLVAVLVAAPAAADFRDHLRSDPGALERELTRFLHDEPEVVTQALRRAEEARARDATRALRDEIAGDRAAIAANAAQLFSEAEAEVIGAATGPIAFATFADPEGPVPERLATLVAQHPGLRIALRDPATNADLMQALGLDTGPEAPVIHVFPELMVRGNVPPIVLEKYLAD